MDDDDDDGDGDDDDDDDHGENIATQGLVEESLGRAVPSGR
jgi:hypothetical protein